VPELLTKADMGLADAEVKGDFAYVANGLEPAPLQGGEDTWRKALQATLLAARVQLMQFPVSDRMGDLVHLECPMRLQLEQNGPFEPAARWLPFALRTGMSCDVDMAAVALAVTAIASDGKPRGVNLSPQSLAHPQFLPRLRERIVAAGASAQQLWVEVDESALERHPDALIELCRQLRPHGVHLGLEHAGDRLSSIGLLLEPGLDYVKIASSWASGVRHDAARRAWLRSSVAMLHGVGLKVFVEGVQDAEDLPELWACGVDGVTGPAVK
jgi:EAL domain-containing protein (putative c-di-GMP-specific phosphodiesterase class I)